MPTSITYFLISNSRQSVSTWPLTVAGKPGLERTNVSSLSRGCIASGCSSHGLCALVVSGPSIDCTFEADPMDGNICLLIVTKKLQESFP
jgi:hypothetical protein